MGRKKYSYKRSVEIAEKQLRIAGFFKVGFQRTNFKIVSFM